MSKLDVRPRCCICGERWMPPEGTDAQIIPCLACYAKMHPPDDGPCDGTGEEDGNDE